VKQLEIIYLDDAQSDLASVINTFVTEIHAESSYPWEDADTCEPIEPNVSELLMSVIADITAAVDADHIGRQDKDLPWHDGLTVSLADAVIRIFDIAGGLDLDLGGALIEKLVHNSKTK